MSDSSASGRRDALPWLLRALGVTFAVLVVTGLYQAFRYQGFAPGDAYLFYRATESVHRWAAYVFLFLLLGTAVAFAARGSTRRGSGRQVAWLGLSLAAVGAVAAIVTGPDLRWDQLALWAVTAGTDIKGVFRLSSVKYVLLGDQPIGVDDYRRTVWLHVLVLPAVALAGVGALWYGVRKRASGASEAEHLPQPEKVEVHP